MKKDRKYATMHVVNVQFSKDKQGGWCDLTVDTTVQLAQESKLVLLLAQVTYSDQATLS